MNPNGIIEWMLAAWNTQSVNVFVNFATIWILNRQTIARIEWKHVLSADGSLQRSIQWISIDRKNDKRFEANGIRIYWFWHDVDGRK